VLQYWAENGAPRFPVLTEEKPPTGFAKASTATRHTTRPARHFKPASNQPAPPIAKYRSR
jgi:hypothetical protein